MKIVYTKSAEKEILKLDKKLGQRIFQKIAQLKDNPYGLGSDKLEEDKGYRIRVGNYRVIYTIDKKNQLITIIRIRHRKEAYK